MQFSDLPVEIWAHAISFVPKQEVARLYTLNSVFLEAGLNARWRDIILHSSYSGTKKVLWLQRLRDPYITRRIKKLTLYLTLTLAKTVDDVLPDIELICNNSKLQELSLDFSTLRMPQSQPFSTILTTLWASEGICRFLESLSIRANSFGFRDSGIGSCRPVFPKLKSFEYVHRGLSLAWLEAFDELPAKPPAEVVAVVLGGGESSTTSTTRRVSSLEKLSITILGQNMGPSGAAGVLEVLAVTSFPKLLALDLTIDMISVGNSMKFLTQFLSENMTSLQTLKVTSVYEELEVGTALLNAVHQNKDALTQLTSLEYLGYSGKHIAAMLKRCQSQLRTLKLHEFVPSSDFIDLLLNDRLPQLQSLSYSVDTFDKYQLFFLLQTLAPELLSLCVYIGPYADLPTNFWVAQPTKHDDKPSRYEKLMCADLAGVIFKEFKLKNIGIWEKNTEWHKETMEVLRQTIPSIQCFFGKPAEQAYQ